MELSVLRESALFVDHSSIAALEFSGSVDYFHRKQREKSDASPGRALLYNGSTVPVVQQGSGSDNFTIS